MQSANYGTSNHWMIQSFEYIPWFWQTVMVNGHHISYEDKDDI